MFFEFFGLEVLTSFSASTRDGHQSCSIRFETIPFFGKGNVKSDGSSIVKSIEADGPIVSDHHIHILPFHVFLASQ